MCCGEPGGGLERVSFLLELREEDDGDQESAKECRGCLNQLAVAPNKSAAQLAGSDGRGTVR